MPYTPINEMKGAAALKVLGRPPKEEVQLTRVKGKGLFSCVCFRGSSASGGSDPVRRITVS
jgi:hypothetical protein